ncbi:MAG: DUF87 domain-containing protein [Planctomycetes bacterium]|nr:DUF87 domain-containing protein [Planctomycetota bacterium]
MSDADTLALFRRLKPLFGQKIDRLWMAYSMGNRDERESIEEILRMMEATSLRSTPDDKTINLPPPPLEVSQGKFHLGSVLFNGKPLHGFALPNTTTLRQHLSTFGRSGAGKSNFIFHLLEALGTEKVPFWIFDWKRDYRALLKRGNAPRPIVFTLGRPLAPEERKLPLRLDDVVPPLRRRGRRLRLFLGAFVGGVLLQEGGFAPLLILRLPLLPGGFPDVIEAHDLVGGHVLLEGRPDHLQPEVRCVPRAPPSSRWALHEGLLSPREGGERRPGSVT